MAKCPICGEKLGFGSKVKVRDGEICTMCSRISSSCATSGIEELRELWENNHSRYAAFQRTNELKSLASMPVTIDDTHEWFYFGKEGKTKVEPVINAFSEVEGYEFEMVGGKTVTKSKGGVGRALVGGALLGPVGAVVGAGTSKKETKTVGGVHILKIELRTAGGRAIVNISNPPAGLTAFLDQCIDAKDEAESTMVSGASEADELLKWKSLLDQGVISEDEFKAKKKQLLGL